MQTLNKVELIKSKPRYNFDDLCLILEILRGEGGCPWDAEQTHESIRKNFLEETYEVLEAIDNKDTELLREELGDVMLQVVFHTQMEKELGHFDINDVANEVCAKLVHRHPHIFGDVIATSSQEVLSNWEAIKSAEKSRVTVYDKLKSIPPMTPSLMRAPKVAKKSGVLSGTSGKALISEAKSLLCKMEETPESVDAEGLSELLFTLSKLAAMHDIDAEEALYRKTNEFIEEFKE